MKKRRLVGYTSNWNAGFYSKLFKNLDDAIKHAKKNNGIVMKRVRIDGRDCDVPLSPEEAK